MSYEDEIMQRIENCSFGGFFRRPSGGIKVKEYPLEICQKTAKADFCYEFGQSGRLFIEPEDDGAQRAVSNLVKYWRWCKENPVYRPVYLISICGPNNINIDHCNFLKKNIETDLGQSFRYYMINHVGADNWHDHNSDWLDQLSYIVDNITKWHS